MLTDWKKRRHGSLRGKRMRQIAVTAIILMIAAPAAYAMDNNTGVRSPARQQHAQNQPQTVPGTEAMPRSSGDNDTSAKSNGATTTGAAPAENKNNSAQQLVTQATSVVKKMESDKQLDGLMKKAKGLFIIPEFGRGAVLIGGRGGAGLVTVHKDGKWSDPAFYDIGGISFGPQVGGSGGVVVFLLMDQTAVDAFKSGNKFALNAGAGLSIVNYSGGSQASWGKGDIVMWTDTSGAYVGATVSVTDVNWSDSNNRAYYGKKTDMTQILNGSVSNAQADELKSRLPD